MLFTAYPVKPVFANECSITNYDTRYVGDPIPRFEQGIGDLIGKIEVTYRYSCSKPSTNDDTEIVLFGAWGQNSYISGNKYSSNLQGIQLETPFSIGSTGAHKTSVILKRISLIGNTVGQSSTIGWTTLFHVRKVGYVTFPTGANSSSMFNLGTSHITHNFQARFETSTFSFEQTYVNKLGFVDIPLETPTCDIDTADQDQTVTLPGVNIHDFAVIGSTGGRTPFSITLHCLRTTRIHATITDLNDPTNTGTNMALSGNSTATGVSLQISAKYDDQIRQFDSASRFYWAGSHEDTETNSWMVPVAVRYVKTQQNMTAGTVNAKMEILFDYE